MTAFFGNGQTSWQMMQALFCDHGRQRLRSMTALPTMALCFCCSVSSGMAPEGQTVPQATQS